MTTVQDVVSKVESGTAVTRSSLLVSLYRALLTIRRSEESIVKHYPEDEMKTPMHMSMGEEAIVVGVCHALAKDDLVIGSYRSHGLFLAKTGDLDAFFLELYGRTGGCGDGKAGSMHLSSPEHGMVMSSAIVGASLPVGIGMAFANDVLKNGRMTAVFFGDGASDEGAFWESVNFACLHRLPILFVCQDNDLAVHTHKSQRRGFNSLPEVLRAFNMNIYCTESTDAEEIFELTRNIIKVIRTDRRPAFLHTTYYRYLEHVGINEDFHDGYRAKSEYEKWLCKDPIRLVQKKLLLQGVESWEIKRVENAIIDQIERSIARARATPFSHSSNSALGVYRCVP